MSNTILTIILILVSMALSGVAQAQENRAAILKAGLPGEDSSLIAAIKKQADAAGYKVTEVDADALCDPARLSIDNYGLLIISNGANLPARSMKPVDDYLKSGGDILVLNAPLWQQPLVKSKNGWISREQYFNGSIDESTYHLTADFSPESIKAWQRSSNVMEKPALYETTEKGPASGLHALHVRVPQLTSWDTFYSPKLSNAFPGENVLTVFSAKGNSSTTQIIVEWTENDGSRWIAAVPLSDKWQRYVLSPDDFRFWESVPNRGGAGDRFNPDNAYKLSIGIAISHINTLGAAPYEYWIGPVSTAGMAEGYDMEALSSLPILDTLSPGYKLFECSDVGSIVYGKNNLPVANAINSPHPRPSGGGFDKGREWRWESLLEARSPKGDWRGTPATLTVNAEGAYKGGVWTSFGVEDMEWYKSPGVLDCIGRVLGRMRDGAFIMDGGSNFYTYFEGQEMKLGVRAVNVSSEPKKGLKAIVRVVDTKTGKAVAERKWNLDIEPGEVAVVSDLYKPEKWPADGLAVTAELVSGDAVIDKVEHSAHCWKPKEKPEFITAKNGEFVYKVERWRPCGINYMPSSGIGVENGRFFELWFDAGPYDPQVIQRDLEHVKDIGFNSVSVFIYESSVDAQNLLDFLRRLDNLGMKANLSLRPGTPMDFPWPLIRKIIDYYKLWDNDTVFAYDLAWEPSFGIYNVRKAWDGNWEDWIIERYGSVENAEKDWNHPCPRNADGKVTNPPDEQTVKDGPWKVMVAAYRRFVDTLLFEKYGEARRLVRSVDSNHAVSFRMSNATNPTYRTGDMGYDFPYLAAAVDVLEPEAYGRLGDWEIVKPGWFQREYARWAAPDMPMIWAEHGYNVWDNTSMADSPSGLERAVIIYESFYKMLILSGADGVFHWWYPGGFRVGENSDYGIINPDGTDREVTKTIREYSKQFINAPSIKPVDHWINIDRDSNADGVPGIYDAVKGEFWEAVSAGRTPGLRTAGTGTTSVNCPLVAVGNIPCTGNNPPKYMDGAFEHVEVIGSDGKWTEVRKGDTVKVAAGKPVEMRVTLRNLGEAEWVSGDGIGSVQVVTVGGEVTANLPAHVGHLQTIADVPVVVPAVNGAADVTLTLTARGRTGFGEKFKLTLRP